MATSAPFIPPTFTPSRAPVRLGHFMAKFIRNPIETLPAQVFEQPAFKAVIMGQQVLFISDPEAVKTVLMDKDSIYPKGEAYRLTLGEALGQGLFTADGQHWRWQRRALAPAFRPRNLAPLVPAMVNAAEITVARWRTHSNGEPINVAQAMMQTTFRIILDTMLSGGAQFDAGEFEAFMGKYAKGVPWVFALILFGLPRWMPHPGRAGMRRAARALRRTIMNVVVQRRNKKEGAPDLIDLLLDAQDPITGRRMSDDEIVDNIATFLAAGHETTAQTLSWTLFLLSAHKESEMRVIEEISTVIGDGPITASALMQLTFTRQVIEEAMRLYPPAPIITREPSEPVTWFERTVRAGSIVEIPIYAIHRHRDLWENPDAFDPDRFAPGKEAERHRFAYLPFGGGTRVCIGATFAMLEALAVLATLMPKVRLRVAPGHQVWPEAFITMRPRRGLPMTIAWREAG